MAVHRVELALPATDIQNADVSVSVWSDDELLGELRISRGSLDWRPGRHQSAWSMEWERFDEVIARQRAPDLNAQEASEPVAWRIRGDHAGAAPAESDGVVIGVVDDLGLQLR